MSNPHKKKMGEGHEQASLREIKGEQMSEECPVQESDPSNEQVK